MDTMLKTKTTQHPEDVLFRHVKTAHNLGSVVDAMQEYSDQQNAELRERVKEMKITIAGYKECFEQFVPEDKWDEATAFLSSYGNGLAKEIQNKGL